MKTKALLPFMLALTAIVLLGCPTPITPPTDTMVNLSAIAGVTAPVADPMYKTYVVNEETLFSTGLPVVSIITENHTKIESKENWIPATMKITNATDESWNFDEIDISIRGRGNSTWGQAKKPFAIKLSKKQKICGMPKHKRWVLIANYLDNSFMKNTTHFT